MNYEGMSNSALMQLRNSLPDHDPRQRQIAPYEHQAFAREWIQDRGWSGVPSMAVAIPGYALAKLLGIQRARTPPSLAQVAHGYRGMGQGIAGLFNR